VSAKPLLKEFPGLFQFHISAVGFGCAVCVMMYGTQWLSASDT